MKKTQHTINTTQKGFTLLFAILVSTLVVSIGATIISIALRQTILSGTNRESNYAFYAANTALECAIYWDTVGVQIEGETGVVFPAIFADSTKSDTRVSDANLASVSCAGVNLKAGIPSATPSVPAWDISVSGETTFHLRIKDEAGLVDSAGAPFAYEYCAQATVIKEVNNTTGTVTTRIEARGYNTCDIDNPRRVERGLVHEYKS